MLGPLARSGRLSCSNFEALAKAFCKTVRSPLGVGSVFYSHPTQSASHLKYLNLCVKSILGGNAFFEPEPSGKRGVRVRL